MNTDTAILILLADQQRLIEALRIQVNDLTVQLEAVKQNQDQSRSQ